MNLKDKIKELASAYAGEIKEIRRHLHMHPELSYSEVETGKFIVSKLEEWGIAYEYPVAGNGVVALLEGYEKGEVRAIRGDIDALPIQEANDVPYKSKNEGVMHACGHDVHTSCILGAAKILHETRKEWKGTIKANFQPAEEKLPGGASIMIKEGVLENPDVKYIVGQHVHPPLEVGKVGVKSGTYMASADEIYITVKGKGGHGALPQNVIDPVLISAQILIALQQVVSRKSIPNVPNVLSFGKINSVGGATNIIPDEVKIEGTFRTMNESWRKEAHEHIRRIAEKTAESMGGTCEVDIRVGYPCLVNNREITGVFKEKAVEYLGEENVVDLPLRMTAEDFAYYGHEVAGCFYRLGTGNKERGIVSPVHTPTFDVDEGSLEVGMGVMAWVVV